MHVVVKLGSAMPSSLTSGRLVQWLSNAWQTSGRSRVRFLVRSQQWRRRLTNFAAPSSDDCQGYACKWITVKNDMWYSYRKSQRASASQRA